MYSRQEASQLRQAFWTTFGRYMAPQPAAEGMRVNWVNYKTGERHLTFAMEAGHKSASIGITLSHPDTGIRELYYEQLTELKALMHGALGEEWTWAPLVADENGRTVSRVYKELPGVSVFRQEDWPALIQFFKPRIIALDEFWSGAKYPFGALR